MFASILQSKFQEVFCNLFSYFVITYWMFGNSKLQTVCFPSNLIRCWVVGWGLEMLLPTLFGWSRVHATCCGVTLYHLVLCNNLVLSLLGGENGHPGSWPNSSFPDAVSWKQVVSCSDNCSFPCLLWHDNNPLSIFTSKIQPIHTHADASYDMSCFVHHIACCLLLTTAMNQLACAKP